MRRRSILTAGLAAVSAALMSSRRSAAANEAPAPGPAVPGAPAAAPATAAPAVVAGRRQLTMVLAWPRAVPGVGAAAERFASAVAALTDGRLTLKVFGAGELVPAAETLDAVSAGIADLGHSASYFWAMRNPAFHFFTGVPFGFTAQEMAAWLRDGGGQSLWEELYRPLDIQPFYAGSSGVQAAGWFRREVTAVGDLKGLKIRIAGLGAEVFKRLGAMPMMMPAAEIPTLLKDGQLDAVEWIGPWSDEAFGLPKLAKYYYLPGLHEPGPAVEIIVNRKVFAALARDQQAAIRIAAAAATAETLAEFTYNNTMALPRLVKEGTELRRFSPEIVKAFAATAQQVIDDLAATDPLTKRIHASYQAFWLASRAYAPFAEGGFLAERQTALP